MARPSHARAARAAAARQSRVLATAGLAALLGGFAAIVIASGGKSGSQPLLPVTTEAAAAPKPAPKPPALVKLAVAGIGAYDPEGDQSENGGDARFATDGNPSTAWKSEHYRAAFTKSGVGLVLDAGRPVKAANVVLTTDTPGYKAQVRVGDAPTGPFAAISGTKTTARRTTFALRARSGRYLMLWIMSMPTGGTAAVNEVVVTARR